MEDRARILVTYGQRSTIAGHLLTQNLHWLRSGHAFAANWRPLHDVGLGTEGLGASIRESDVVVLLLSKDSVKFEGEEIRALVLELTEAQKEDHVHPMLVSFDDDFRQPNLPFPTHRLLNESGYAEFMEQLGESIGRQTGILRKGPRRILVPSAAQSLRPFLLEFDKEVDGVQVLEVLWDKTIATGVANESELCILKTGPSRRHMTLGLSQRLHDSFRSPRECNALIALQEQFALRNVGLRYVRRRRNEIQTSHRNYEFLLLTGKRKEPLFEGAGDFFRSVTDRVAEEMIQRCQLVIPFFRYPSIQSCSGSHDRFCVVSAERQLDDNVAKQRGATCSPDTAAWLELRSALLRRAWNFPTKMMNCPKTMLKRRDGTYAVAFGKIDFVYLQPTNHSFWSSRIRSLMAENERIRAMLSIPSYRIKHERWESITFEGRADKPAVSDLARVIAKESAPSRLLVLTLIPRVQKKEIGGEDDSDADSEFGSTTRLSRTHVLHKVADFVLGPVNGDAEHEPLRDRFPGSHIELFLTLSRAYPFLIKAEFYNLAMAYRYLEELRQEDQIIPWTSSILSVIGEQLMLNERTPDRSDFTRGETTAREVAEMQNKCLEVQEPHDLSVVQVLLKLSYPDHRTTLNKVVSLIKKYVLKTEGCGGVDKSEESVSNLWFERPFYWDAALEVRTLRLGWLLQFVADHVRSMDGVEHTATIPMVGHRWHNASPIELRSSASPQPMTEMETVEHGPYPCYPGHDALETASTDALNMSLYNLQFEHQWYLQYFKQLKAAWRSEGLVAAPSALSPRTFDRMLGILSEQMKVLAQLADQSQDLQIVSKMWSLLEPTLEEQAALREERRVFAGGAWKVVKHHMVTLERLKRECARIATEFHERTEVHQILLASEPLMRIGAQAGVMDIAVHAADRLFRHYCSYPVGKTGETEQAGEWRGIVSCSSGDDFMLVAEVQTLYLPIDFKLHTGGKLVPLAHEAAHYVQYLFDTSLRDVAVTFIADVADPLRKAVSARIDEWFALQERVWSETVEAQVKGHYNRLLELLWKESFYDNELLADMIAGLTAGPAYYRALRSLAYLPPDARNLTDPLGQSVQSFHPPVSLRLRLGALMAKELMWVSETEGEGSAGDDLWGIVGPLRAMLEEHDAESLHFETEYSRPDKLWDIMSRGDIFSRSPAEGEKVVVLGLPELLNRELPLATFVFDAVRREPQLLWNLVYWLHEHGESYLFYPLPKRKRGDPRLADEFKASVEWVNQYCCYLAERLLFNDEVLLDAPLRYIAAAAELPLLGRPVYCSGRILLSLYYAKNDHDSWLRAFEERDVGVFKRDDGEHLDDC